MVNKYTKKGFFICERSGFEYPIKYMLKEPGTGLIIARQESDGKYNLVDHPQNHIRKKADSRIIKNARPDRVEEHDYLTDENGNILVGILTFGVQQGIIVKEG